MGPITALRQGFTAYLSLVDDQTVADHRLSPADHAATAATWGLIGGIVRTGAPRSASEKLSEKGTCKHLL
jgi:hypothetical protein